MPQLTTMIQTVHPKGTAQQSFRLNNWDMLAMPGLKERLGPKHEGLFYITLRQMGISPTACARLGNLLRIGKTRPRDMSRVLYDFIHHDRLAQSILCFSVSQHLITEEEKDYFHDIEVEFERRSKMDLEALYSQVTRRIIEHSKRRKEQSKHTLVFFQPDAANPIIKDDPFRAMLIKRQGRLMEFNTMTATCLADMDYPEKYKDYSLHVEPCLIENSFSILVFKRHIALFHLLADWCHQRLWRKTCSGLSVNVGHLACTIIGRSLSFLDQNRP